MLPEGMMSSRKTASEAAEEEEGRGWRTLEAIV